jgi:hypothetical protein
VAGRRAGGWARCSFSALAFAAVVFYESTIPRHLNPEGNAYTARIWRCS